LAGSTSKDASNKYAKTIELDKTQYAEVSSGGW
jgi:hypothetical protein